MLKIVFTFIITLVCNTIQAQAFNWANQLGGAKSIILPKVVLADGSGNVYTCGFFTDTVDFDPGTKVYKLGSAGGYDMFLTKFNVAGSFVWAKRIGGKGSDVATSMVLDASGNIFTTGSFTDEVDFDPGSGTQTLKSSGNTNMFISKLDSSGNFVWVKHITSNKEAGASSITLDDKQCIYTTGSFAGLADFDPGAATATLSAFYGDIFILKLNSSGNYVWAKQFKGNNKANGNSIAVDAQHNVYTTGRFSDNVDFDPGASTAMLSTGGNWNFFISKLDSSGNYAWAKQVLSNEDENSNSIALDAAANVYTTGNFWGTVDIDPGSDSAFLVSAGALDIFILKLDKSGNYVWAKRMGGSRNDNATYISLDESGNIYTTGAFEDSVDFDPGSSRKTLKVGGYSDVFVSKLNSAGNFVFALQYLSGTGDTHDNGTCVTSDKQGYIYTTGYFDGMADFNPNVKVFNLKAKAGIDAFVVKLEQCNTSAFTITDTSCGKYVINGTTYTSSGFYTQVLENKEGCDSTLFINLTIKKNSVKTLTDTACRYYKLNGQTYTSSGVYKQTLVNKAKCDSIITLDLTINTVNNTVTQAGAMLTANATGVAYKWLDCNKNKLPIPGETSQIFTATKNGSYAVELTQKACKDTSSCYAVTGFNAVANIGFSKGFTLYPNPTFGHLKIEMNTPLGNGTLKLITLSGQVIIEKTGLTGSSISLDLNNQPAGIYFIEIHQNGNVFRAKVMKE